MKTSFPIKSKQFSQCMVLHGDGLCINPSLADSTNPVAPEGLSAREALITSQVRLAEIQVQSRNISSHARSSRH